MWLGHLDRYPDYMTQGMSLDDLREHLLDLYKDLSAGKIPSVRQHAELELVGANYREAYRARSRAEWSEWDERHAR